MHPVAMGLETVEEPQMVPAGNADGELVALDDKLVGQHWPPRRSPVTGRPLRPTGAAGS
jgi:hypothetical protein